MNPEKKDYISIEKTDPLKDLNDTLNKLEGTSYDTFLARYEKEIGIMLSGKEGEVCEKFNTILEEQFAKKGLKFNKVVEQVA